jgi:hypothetical protein
MKPQTFQPYNQLHVQVNKLRHSPRIHRIYENDSIHTGNNQEQSKDERSTYMQEHRSWKCEQTQWRRLSPAGYHYTKKIGQKEEL